MMAKDSEDIFSLRENCRARFLKDFLSVVRVSNPSAGDFILVLDKFTTRIMSSFANTFYFLSKGVALVENIELVRKPFPNIHAIYFLSPKADQLVVYYQILTMPKKKLIFVPMCSFRIPSALN
mgnify:CR=1 FL=1